MAPYVDKAARPAQERPDPAPRDAAATTAPLRKVPSRLPAGMATRRPTTAPKKGGSALRNKPPVKSPLGRVPSAAFSKSADRPLAKPASIPPESQKDTFIQMRSASANPPTRGELINIPDALDRIPSRSLEPHRRVAVSLRKKDRTAPPRKPGTPGGKKSVTKASTVTNQRAKADDRQVTPARHGAGRAHTPKQCAASECDTAHADTDAGTQAYEGTEGDEYVPGDENEGSNTPRGEPGPPAEIMLSTPVMVVGADTAEGRQMNGERQAFERPSPPGVKAGGTADQGGDALRFTATQTTAVHIEAQSEEGDVQITAVATTTTTVETVDTRTALPNEASASSKAPLQPSAAAFARSPSPHTGPGPSTLRRAKPAAKRAANGAAKGTKKKVVKKMDPSEKPPLLPAQREEWDGVVTVVLDMDETLLWHPSLGNVYLRPGARDLLKGLKGRCEVVLWTASTKAATDIALAAVNIQPSDFTHIITRDRRWFNWKRATKDIRLLGRDLGRVVVVENSPFCLKLNSKHGLLVTDFRMEKSNRMAAARDDTLYKVDRVLQRLIASSTPVPDFLRECEDCELKHFRLTASPTLSSFYCII